MKRARLDPHQFIRRIPLLPHQLQQRLTPVEGAIVLCHLGVPRLSREEWSLAIEGLLARPRTLSFPDLLRYEKIEVASVHQCAGSPLAPNEPTQRVCNVTWGGARLADILADCAPHPSARFVWSSGADHGTFGEVSVEAYVKDLPIERLNSDVLVAYEMNGAQLAPENGFPARLVVPGFYGTNSVKWLTCITLAGERAQSPFTTRWYNDPVEGEPPGNRTTPVWAIAPQSVIVAPAPNATIPRFGAVEVWGWAWADGGVSKVEVTADADEWRLAALEPHSDRGWQRFSISWTPAWPGVTTLASRATAVTGDTQPEMRTRNAIYRVPVKVA
ncbi:MAG TPA: molybdopterin-dependent oxidoreductase [Xanthobacteraceae bacterium]